MAARATSTSAARAAAAERAWLALMELVASREGSKFRRQDLTEVLVGKLRKGNMSERRERATSDADSALARAHGEGIIARNGRLHWVQGPAWKGLQQGRKLLDGSVVPDRPDEVTLTLRTRAPEKWIAVDLETGQAWLGSSNGWTHPGSTHVAMLKLVANKR